MFFSNIPALTGRAGDGAVKTASPLPTLDIQKAHHE